ncbi:MAG: class I SAM-dependent methyltransferase [Acidobacteriota bacterium]
MTGERRDRRMYDHFSRVSGAYNELRTTDPEPIDTIRGRLGGRGPLRGADIGCGGGRYDLLLLRQIEGLHLICNDVNGAMVEETERYLRSHGIGNFSTLVSDVASLELPEGSLDCILTFNAIHHFDPLLFLSKACRALNSGGQAFIYTRLRSQNARSVWGRFFPGFARVEDRLYELSDVEAWSQAEKDLRLASIDFFRFRRLASLDQLLQRASGRHYSTFSLFAAEEFERSLAGFQERIRKSFVNCDRVEWFDENVIITFRKG